MRLLDWTDKEKTRKPSTLGVNLPYFAWDSFFNFKPMVSSKQLNKHTMNY